MNSKFDIINASAGSGKTFALTKRILTKILKSKDENYFKRILALTFTNRAAAEMKSRILKNLKDFSESQIKDSRTEMFEQVKKELALSSEKIIILAKERLNLLLHNYSFFQIETLDSFNHHIIRAFYKELNLDPDFRVVIEAEEILDQSVSRIFENIENDKEIRNLIKEFSIKKISEGKSWDVEFDLKEFAQSVLKENEISDVEQIEKSSLKEFKALKNSIELRLNDLSIELNSLLIKIEKNISNQGTEIAFSRNSFPKFITSVQNRSFKWSSMKSISTLFEKNTLINKSFLKKNPDKLNVFVANLFELFLELKECLVKTKVLNSFLYSLTPSILLKIIKSNSEDIQKENNELLLSKFNKLIYKEIGNQPTPYLYEKLGVKFNDYLIDEFQDTSNLQWKNLIPLISHALESFQENENQGSLFLVGDPKQSVYRWRGADPKIFVSLLLNEKTPFSVQKSITNLPVNFRSRNEIINFNNSLFKHASGLLKSNYHKKIFLQGSDQKYNNFSNGHVSITFINKDFKKEQQLESVLKETLSQIENCLSRGFEQSEIAVLVRDNKQSSQISERLIENNVSVLSQDSLSIDNSEKIELLINLIKLKDNNRNQEARAILIGNFANLVKPKDLFVFYKENLNNELKRFLKNLNIFSLYKAFEISFLESVDFFIKELQMDLSNTDPYILFFREVIFEQVSQNKNNEKEFLVFWKKNSTKIKIPSGSSKNAVQVLTIHKAKGLEFPVVIYPFVDSVTHRNSGKRNWLPVFEENLSKNILIPFNENFREYSDSFQKEYDSISSNEELDNLNLLYVALTRAVDELHMISEYPKIKSINSHNQIIRTFLEDSARWKEDYNKYNWGKPIHKEKSKKNEPTPFFKGYETKYFQPNPDKKFSNEKIIFGNVFHDFMSNIEFETDYIKEKNELKLSRSVDKTIKNKVIKLSKSVIEHPDLNEYFSKSNLVYCEQEIFTESKKIIKPDRLVFLDSNRVVIIDYKTGEKSKKDQKQILKYQKTLEKMGFKLEASVLVYVENTIDIVQVK
ncbi:UvrD-helicase domain-containing protein [Flavobacteriaceae bacterium]|nr:UvrD-helicase domain-containing protein [Flavobacteriaceae bacterium]MDC1459114.1 UvrD-helicase domain-containing protein [Flavobacteriaceae bacterium]